MLSMATSKLASLWRRNTKVVKRNEYCSPANCLSLETSRRKQSVFCQIENRFWIQKLFKMATS